MDNDYADAETNQSQVAGSLPDGSGFFVASMPLPKDHWLYQEPVEPPPSLIFNDSVLREDVKKQLRAAAQYVICRNTKSGTDMDFDPDALVIEIINATLGTDGMITELPDESKNKMGEFYSESIVDPEPPAP